MTSTCSTFPLPGLIQVEEILISRGLPIMYGHFAHAQTVDTRPLFGGEWPGDEAISV